MQQLWKDKVSWDESIQGSLFTEWIKFKSELHLLNDLKIPRHILCLNPIRVEMHGFCDASEHAYGACIFIRSVNNINEITVKLICAKARVAPLKNLTIPRLELCGAVLLAQLSAKVRDTIQIKFDQYYYSCDSTILLHWIQAPSYRWKTFVANRVSEVQNLTQIEQWRHVNSSENAADLISRGVTPENLINSTLWWYGPDFLSKGNDTWPNQSFISADNLNIIESRTEVTILHTTRKLEDRRYGQVLTVAELQQALLHLVKVAQNECFRKDIRDLQERSCVSSTSSILKLNPFIDKNGLIRVGGRLQNSHYEYEKKHPVLLHPKHKLTKLILRNEHEKLGHCGPQSLLSSIRQQFWPLAGKTLARKIVHDCVLCFKSSPKGQIHIMGNLPEARVTEAPPFYNCGVDYAGPFLLRDKRSRGYKIIKSYICLFICFSTKAIHLELVSDLTAETFIAAFRRFCSRRGKPLNIYSDNGTNFVKANSELKELATFLLNDHIQIESNFATIGVQWHFIPPKSPHFGGFWEGGVKSVKQHLKRVFRDASLVYEEFLTVLVQIEAILNSRPILPLSSDPNDLHALTPAHFLIGRELTSLPDPNFNQRRQQIIQHFWSRWVKEYLNELQQRVKWNRNSETSQQRLKPGALVIIKEDNIPPLRWNLGCIVEVHPGKDDVIRVVTIKSSTSVLKISVTKICLLPVE